MDVKAHGGLSRNGKRSGRKHGAAFSREGERAFRTARSRRRRLDRKPTADSDKEAGRGPDAQWPAGHGSCLHFQIRKLRKLGSLELPGALEFPSLTVTCLYRLHAPR